jgi:hypothetical protein
MNLRRRGDNLMSENKPKLSDLTFFGSEVNSAISRGQGKTISFEDIHDNLEAGNIVEWLNKKLPFPGGADLGPLIELKRCAAINHALNDVAGGFYGRERRKLGIDSSDDAPGLHLLLGVILDAIQQKYWSTEN